MAAAAGRSAGTPLQIYLNDHFGGATAGLEMFRRAAAAQRDQPAGPALERLAAEVAQDRERLRDIMRSLGVRPKRSRVAAGWVAEKAGRLKLNGRLVRRAPLSDLMELEALLLGVEGKGAGFRALRALSDREAQLDPAQLDALADRARQQARTLEELRVRAAAVVLGEGVRPSGSA